MLLVRPRLARGRRLSDRFVKSLDHPACGAVGFFSERAQLFFVLDRNIEIQSDRITNFLGEGFTSKLCPAREPLLLIRIQMNERRGHVMYLYRTYIIAWSHRRAGCSEAWQPPL